MLTWTLFALVPKAAGVLSSPLADFTANGIGVAGRDETNCIGANGDKQKDSHLII